MSSLIGVWIAILLIVLAFMAIRNYEPKSASTPERQPIVPPVIPRPRPVQSQTLVEQSQTTEQQLARIQAEYQRKLALLQRAIPDPMHRRLAEQELYSQYLYRLKDWLS